MKHLFSALILAGGLAAAQANAACDYPVAPGKVSGRHPGHQGRDAGRQDMRS